MGSAAAPERALGYVREFTRHSSDVLGNLNELRLRGILTDVTLLVGGQPLRAHKAVLIACSGFFYSIFRGRAGVGVDVLSLPGGPEAGGFAPLLDFMYTSRLRLSPATAPAVLAAATYLQMDHVVQACHRFIQARLSPTAVQFKCGAPANPPHLTPRAQEATASSPCGRSRPPPGSEFFSCQNCEAVAGCSSGLDPLAPGDEDKPYKCQLCRSAFRYKGNLASHRTVHTGSTSARARADPHRGEALSLPHVRDSLPAPTDPQKPRSHPHGGEALPLRPLWPAFPAQESTAAASAPETRSCYQHQSALPHSGGALAEQQPGPSHFLEAREAAGPPLASLSDLGMEVCKAPPFSETASTFISHWGEQGWQIRIRSASVLLVKTSSPQSIVSEERAS
ncbi:B-cell CLL/lymphoma 6 member B protein isoform X3 [Myotis myotis]|uniref:B-cell CLL/lymphoma 6 member B protein isoform X3 n=1 Tax=Myotis myotis TaxID=51298 RepID=UPI00174B0A5C|nr:B-cell CLL/lymphoma 6 member B protein isoform X3 [Myotis myotis]